MIVFDLDGVLCDTSHRRHFVDRNERNRGLAKGDLMCLCQPVNRTCDKCRNLKPDIAAYDNACDGDGVIRAGLIVFCKYLLGTDYKVEIWSSRCESQRNKTIKWLCDNWFIGLFDFEVSQLSQCIKMRPIGNTEPEWKLKESWLDEYYHMNVIPAQIEGRITNAIDFVFDADSDSIAMWKRRGVFVFDCRQV